MTAIAADDPADPYSFATPEFSVAPIPVLNRLREEAPVHRHTDGTWTLTRHEDVLAGVKDHATYSNLGAAYFTGTRAPDEYGKAVAVRRLSARDEPSHGSLRRLMAPTFTPRSLGKIKPRIEVIVEELLGEMRARAADGLEVEFVRDFAYPLTILSMNLILGVPDSVRDLFRNYTGAIDNTIGEYFLELVKQKEKDPGEDFTSDLIRAARAGHQYLPPEDVHYYLGGLWTAGNWTTTLLLSNAAALLQTQGGVRDALEADPDLVPSFVEEALRFDPPVIWTGKIATRDVTVRGETIREGDKVLFCYGAANHDPRVFRDPQTFDLRRDPNPHISFTDGIHFCLGAPLARMEAVAAFRRLTRPDARFAFDLARSQRGALAQLSGYRVLPTAFAA